MIIKNIITDIIKQTFIAVVLFILISKLALAFGDFELRRLKLPGFWHTFRGRPLELKTSVGDISYLPLLQKAKLIWRFILTQDV